LTVRGGVGGREFHGMGGEKGIDICLSEVVIVRLTKGTARGMRVTFKNNNGLDQRARLRPDRQTARGGKRKRRRRGKRRFGLLLNGLGRIVLGQFSDRAERGNTPTEHREGQKTIYPHWRGAGIWRLVLGENLLIRLPAL